MMNLLLVENHSAQEYRVKGGAQNISRKLAEKIGSEKVLLCYQAVKIEQSEGKVQVEFANGQVIQARKVISTLPPNMVVKNIEFLPGNQTNQRHKFQY